MLGVVLFSLISDVPRTERSSIVQTECRSAVAMWRFAVTWGWDWMGCMIGFELRLNWFKGWSYNVLAEVYCVPAGM